MASLCKAFLLLILCSSFNQFFFVTSIEFEVGGDDGWVVPKSRNDQMYNQWASKNRFNVDDTVSKYYNISNKFYIFSFNLVLCVSLVTSFLLHILNNV
jgi:hypothetical protein